MTKQKKPTFADDGYEINSGCRIRRIEVINEIYYYQVNLQTLSGNPIRKRFINAKPARSFAERIGSKGTDEGITAWQFIDPDHVDAIKASILDLFNASLSKVTQFCINHNDRTYGVEELVQEFIAEKQGQIDHGELLPAAFVDPQHLLKRFSREFGHRALNTVTADEVDGFLNKVKGVATRRSHQLHISAFFNWAVTQERLSFSPIGPTFADNGYEINSGCRIRRIEVINEFYYYQVNLQRLSGNPIRKSFIHAKHARSFARKVGSKGTDSGIKALRFIDSQRIDAVKATILDLYNASLRKAA
jgi:hypothetical protein